MSDHPQVPLRSNVIGLVGAATLGMVFLSPAMTLYGLFGPMYLACGDSVPVPFILGLLATLPTAFSYAVLSRDRPSSGSVADWATQALGTSTGGWAGWLVFLYYLTNFVIQLVAAGIFFNELLRELGIVLPLPAGYVIGVLAGAAWPAWMVYRGLSVSVRGALLFLLIEMATVAALCGSVLWAASSRGTVLTADGFSLPTAFANRSGLIQALIFALLGYTGFDVISTVAEETRTARTLIPRATILALLLYAVFVITGMWALTYGGDPAQLKAAAEAGRMPINDIAQSIWGRGSIVITLTALTATLALIVATSVGASRVLFDLGRRGVAATRFARNHPRFQVPWSALHLIFGLGLTGAFVVAGLIGPYGAYVWWATTSTFFAMLTFVFGNLSAIILNRSRLRWGSGLLLYGCVPALGIAIDIAILTKAFFAELWQQPWATGKSAVAFDVACAGIALVVAFCRPRPSTQQAIGSEALTDLPP